MATITGLMMAGLLATGGAPDMYVDARGLSMARPGDALVLAERIRSASGAWCATHRAVLTPDHIGDPRVCEREMKRRAIHQVPWAERLLFVRAGGQRALNL